MNDHQQITAERGRRAADLRAAAVALLEQQAIASGVMLDLDSDQVVAAGPKAAILCLLSNGAPAASTTGAAQTADQVRDQALEEAAAAMNQVPMWSNCSILISDAQAVIRALKRPTTTHNSEAGDADQT